MWKSYFGVAQSIAQPLLLVVGYPQFWVAGQPGFQVLAGRLVFGQALPTV
jgi:hypothetical protein